MNLEKLRDLDWMTMWRQVAEKELMVMIHTALADQVNFTWKFLYVEPYNPTTFTMTCFS